MNTPLLSELSGDDVEDILPVPSSIYYGFAELAAVYAACVIAVSLLWYHGDADAVEKAFYGLSATVESFDGDLWLVFMLGSCLYTIAILWAWLGTVLEHSQWALLVALGSSGTVGMYSIAKIILRASLLIDDKWLWSTPCVTIACSTYLGVRGWFILEAKQGHDEDRDYLRRKRESGTESTKSAVEGMDDRERRRKKRRAALRQRADSLDGEADEDRDARLLKRIRKAKGEDEYGSESDGEEDRDTGSKPGADGKLKPRPSTLSRLLGTMLPDWWIIAMGFVCLVLAAGANVLVPHYTGAAVDAVAIRKDEKAFVRSVLLLLGMGVVQAVFGGLRGGLLSWSIARFRRRVRDRMLRAVLRQELGYFESTMTGDIMSRLCVDTNKMGDQISLNLNVFLRSLVSFAGVLGFMFSINWQLTVVTFIVLPPTLVMAKVYGGYLHTLYKKSQRALADCNSTAEEAIAHIATVRVFAAERVEIARYRGDLDEFVGYQVQVAVTYCFYVIFTTALPVAVTCCILYVGGVSVYHGRMGGGSLVSFLLYQQQLSSSFQSLGDVFSGLFQATGAAEKVFDIIDRQPTIDEPGKLTDADVLGAAGGPGDEGLEPEEEDFVKLGIRAPRDGAGGGQAPYAAVSLNGDIPTPSLSVGGGNGNGAGAGQAGGLTVGLGAPRLPLADGPTSSGASALGVPALSSYRGCVELRDVWFRYPTRPEHPVLKGVSLRADPGQVVALVGPSGGGKSSIVKLIERLYEPERGEVLLDGRPLKELPYLHRARAISVVAQEPCLFARSIFENIVYGLEAEVRDGKVTRADVERAARQANAHDFIAAFPDGYETYLGERGVAVSGGQKQRIAIARALVRQPMVYLLDESTSALDAENERVVQAALDELMQAGRATVIVVAHRLSTVQNADKIVVIDQGEVKEQGKHDELLALRGLYASLVRRQMGPDEGGLATAAAGGRPSQSEAKASESS